MARELGSSDAVRKSLIDFCFDIRSSAMENLDKNYVRESQVRQIKLGEIEEIGTPELT